MSTHPQSTVDHDAENAALRARSGKINHEDRLTSFLYDLLRDHLPAGVVEKLVREALAPVQYTNGWLASYAHDLAKRLLAQPDYRPCAGPSKHSAPEPTAAGHPVADRVLKVLDRLSALRAQDKSAGEFVVVYPNLPDFKGMDAYFAGASQLHGAALSHSPETAMQFADRASAQEVADAYPDASIKGYGKGRVGQVVRRTVVSVNYESDVVSAFMDKLLGAKANHPFIAKESA